jgi:hypothetical protein
MEELFIMSNLKKVTDKSLDALAGHPGDLLKLVLSVGVPVAVPVFDYASSRIKEARMKVFIEQCTEKAIVDKLGQNEKNQFYLVMHAMMKAAECSHDAKIVRISEVLSYALDHPKEMVCAEDFINIVCELSENEAACFGKIYRALETKDPDDDSNKKIIADYGADIIRDVDLDDRIFLFSRLAGKGLIRQDTATKFSNFGTNFYTTKIGEKLYQFIQATYESQAEKTNISS